MNKRNLPQIWLFVIFCYNPQMLENKVAVITGAASGIGFETTKRFTKDSRYENIYALDKNPLVCNLYDKGVVRAIELDLRDEDRVATFISDVLESKKKIDLLVNGAGVLNVGRVETYVDAQGNPTPHYQEMFETNYEAPLRLMGLVLPAMREQGYGVIVNITSTKEYVQDPYHRPYADLKAMLTQKTLEMASQERQNGVRIVALQPGNTKTNIDPGNWTEGGSEREEFEVQSLNDWWRKTFGNKPENVAEVIYKIAEGEIQNSRVLTGIDAKLADIMRHIPYWDKMFSLGYNSAILLTRLSLTLQGSYESHLEE